MNTKQIKCAALAAVILAGVGVAYGAPESALHVVYCKATLTSSVGEEFVSVTLPPTEGYYDNNGNPLTYWNVGNVPAGGVADSWHGEGGPGRFTARNEGNVGAYFYVTTCGGIYQGWIAPGDHGKVTFAWDNVYGDIFGENNTGLAFSAISPSELRKWSDSHSYHLAYTTDTMTKVPTWHSLDHRCIDGAWTTFEFDDMVDAEVAAYMGYVDAGDYLTFDLKFWAPRYAESGNFVFTFCVEASSFPLWDHGRAVE